VSTVLPPPPLLLLGFLVTKPLRAPPMVSLMFCHLSV
jgi:hypothetical protein